MNRPFSRKLSRRRFLSTGLTAVAGGLGLTSLAPLTALAAPAPRTGRAGGAASPGRLRELRLTAAGDIELGFGQRYRTWLYNGAFPGPALRVREGERLRVTVSNQLAEGTTVHWHGIPVPNEADGVPGLTEAPIAPGESFLYEFQAAPAGA